MNAAKLPAAFAAPEIAPGFVSSNCPAIDGGLPRPWRSRSLPPILTASHPNAGSPMLVEQIWTANAGRNFNYLIACPETGEALAVDPLDAEKCLAAAKRRGWTITQILNTHEHRDHTGGNDQMIAATGAKLLAHANAK